LFEHNYFKRYEFDEVPLDQDIYLVDENFLEEYEKMMLAFFSGGTYEQVGYVSFVAARRINSQSIDLSWYANVSDRFHEVSISLPKEYFRICVGCQTCQEKPIIFVDSAWLEQIYLRAYSVFGLIDAIGVKEKLQNNGLQRDSLIELRNRIDELAKIYPDISFISFADSILLKSNWSVGYFKSPVEYTYHPERFIHLFGKLKSIYNTTLNLDIYGIFAQGSNEYYEDPLLHISESENHICLNSLGLPFAQLQAIDNAARSAIREKRHAPANLYMDKLFYNSLKFRHAFRKHEGEHSRYDFRKADREDTYYYASYAHILENIH